MTRRWARGDDGRRWGLPDGVRSRMSNVDAAWLGLDEPENLMMITAVLEFAEPVDWQRLQDVVGVRLLERYPKFSQRAVPARVPWEQPVWEDDPGFALDSHLRQVDLGEGRGTPADREALAGLVSRLMSTPLDMRRSPWQLTLVDGYGSGSAVVARLHHCLADGIALASVLLSLTDDSPTAPVGDGAPFPPAGRPSRRPGVVARARAGSAEVSSVVGVPDPAVVRDPRQLLRAARFGVDVARTVVRILALSRDPRTRLRGRLGVAKQAAWTAPRPLTEIRAVAATTGATVNDVLLAAAAGALRRHFLDHGDRPHDVRIFVPVDLRGPGEPVTAELGNRFGLVLVRLPVAEPDAAARIHAVAAQMRSLKASTEAAATFAVLSLVGVLPEWARGLVVRIIGSKTTAIVTNVPGPRRPVYLAGSPVAGVVFWVPQAASLGLGVSIFSYAGAVTLGVAADARLVPDPGALAGAVADELDDLHAAAAPPAAVPG